MPSLQRLRQFVNERLTAAAEEIFGVFEQTVVEYEEEIDRQRRLLDIVLKPDINLHRIEPQQHVIKEEEGVSSDQQLCKWKRNTSLDQEDPEPPHIKEEPCTSHEEEQLELDQEVLVRVCDDSHNTENEFEDSNDLDGTQHPTQDRSCTSQEEEEQVELKQETDTYMLISVGERGYSSDDQTQDSDPTGDQPVGSVSAQSFVLPEPNGDKQLPCYSSPVDTSQDCTETNQDDCESNESTEPIPRQRLIRTHRKKCETCREGRRCDAHTRTHTSKKSYQCHLCERYFSSNNGLLCHIRTHTGERPFPCNKCEKAFSHVSALNRHMRVHTGEKPYTCNICGKRFRDISVLNRHMRIHTGERPYPCNSCDKTFYDQSTLNRHVRIHTDVKPYSCEFCRRDFRNNGDLKIHVRTHTGEKPYLCNTCGKRFGDTSSLRKHETIHTGEKPYLCNTCGKRFGFLSTLKRHVSIHTDEKPYPCNTCGKRFRHLGQVKVHLRIHTGEKPYPCNTCGKRFRYLTQMTVHLRTHAAEEMHTNDKEELSDFMET